MLWTKTTNGYEATGANGDRYAVLRTPGRRFLLRRNDADTDHKPGKLDDAKAAAEAIEASLPPPADTWDLPPDPVPGDAGTVTAPTIPAPEPHPEPPPIADPPGEPVGGLDLFGPSSVPVRTDGTPVLSWLSPAA